VHLDARVRVWFVPQLASLLKRGVDDVRLLAPNRTTVLRDEDLVSDALESGKPLQDDDVLFAVLRTGPGADAFEPVTVTVAEA
jgi:hypothetical protein